MKRRRGSRVTPPLDVAALARALAIPGGDLRHWSSYGTVAAVNDDDGAMDLSNPNAIVITPAGVDVDVVLEPSNYPVTCRHGIAAGAVFICAPIRVGDLVVVGIPDGDPGMVPVIHAVVSSASSPIPVGDDGKPVFQNDRLLVMAKGVPVDLRATDGENTAQVLVNPDGTIELGPGAEEQLVLGTTYRGAESTLNDATVGLQFIWDQAQAVCAGPLAPLKPWFIAAAKAIAAYEAQAGGFLSDQVKTK